MYLWREVFQMEHFTSVTDLDAPAREAAPETENSLLAVSELSLRLRNQGTGQRPSPPGWDSMKPVAAMGTPADVRKRRCACG